MRKKTEKKKNEKNRKLKEKFLQILNLDADWDDF